MNMIARPPVFGDEPLEDLVLEEQRCDETEILETIDPDDCDSDTSGDGRLVFPDGHGFGAIGLAEQNTDGPFDFGDRRDYSRDAPEELSEFEKEQILAAVDAIGGEREADDVQEQDVLLPNEIAAATETLSPRSEGSFNSPSIQHSVPQVSFTGLPAGFSVRPDGIYVVVASKKADDDLVKECLCSPVRVIDRFRQPDAKGYGRRIAVTNPDRGESLIPVLDHDLENAGKKNLSTFVDLGLRFGKVKRARETVLDLLRRWNPDKLLLSSDRLGWADASCEAFVLGDGRILGNPDVVSLNTESSAVADAICNRGTLADWKKEVAAYCIGNPLMTTVVSLAFVGSLLEVLGRNGGGLHLRGGSSKGKTTLQQAAAMVWGSPDLVQSWRTTDNALEVAAVSANGMLLVLDELGEVSGQALHAAAYMLANGKGKARLGALGRQTAIRKWKVALVSSGEIGIAEKIAEGGKRVKAGQEVRMIDVVADAGNHGAFDTLHGCADGAAFAKMITRASRENHGCAGPAFVEWLLKNREEVADEVRSISKRFTITVEKVYQPPNDGVTGRTLDWFALVAAAGDLATRAGLTGWPALETAGAVADTFGAWLDSRTPDDLGAVDRVRTYLAANSVAFVVVAKSDGTAVSSIGWQDNGFFYIPKQTWSAIHNGISAVIAARELERAGHLVRGDDGNLMSKLSSTILGRPRAYAIRKSILGKNSVSGQAE